MKSSFDFETKSLKSIAHLIEKVNHDPNQSLCMYANEDISCDKGFFMRRHSKFLLDGMQLSSGIRQQGDVGIVQLPLSLWHESGKIDLSILNIGVYQIGIPLIKFLKQHYGDKPLVGAELGVWEGDNAIAMLENLNIKTLYLVDPYEHNPEFQPYNHDLFMYTRKAAYKRMAPYHKRIKWIDKKSIDAIHEIEGPLDFCYVDSCHNRDVVSAELPIYYEVVKDNGIFAGHDYANKEVLIPHSENAFLRNVEVHSCVDEFVIERQIPRLYYSYKALQWFIVKNGIYCSE